MTGGRNIAEYDWTQIVIAPCTCEDGEDWAEAPCTCLHGDGMLHAPADSTPWDDWDGDPVHVSSLCGIEGRLIIPGVGSRMGCLRCPKCCTLAGLPQGKGSPKNDADCREILGMNEPASTGRASNGRVKVGRATVSWGPRRYGQPMIIANAPLVGADDLVRAVNLARSQIADQSEASAESAQNVQEA